MTGTAAEIHNDWPCMEMCRQASGPRMMLLSQNPAVVSADRPSSTGAEHASRARRSNSSHPPRGAVRGHSAGGGALRSLGLAPVWGAAAASAVLLGLDATPRFLQGGAHRIVSAAPLFAIAAVFLAAQIVLRPTPGELARRVLLSIAFLLWGGDALFSQYAWAAVANDAAVALFVLDLALVTRDHLRQRAETAGPSPARLERTSGPREAGMT